MSVTFSWVGVDGCVHFLAGYGWVWVSMTFFWLGVGECGRAWVGVGECTIYNCPIMPHMNIVLISVNFLKLLSLFLLAKFGSTN